MCLHFQDCQLVCSFAADFASLWMLPRVDGEEVQQPPSPVHDKQA